MVDVPVTLSLVLVASVYARAWLRLRRMPGRAIGLRSLGAFMAGLVSIWLAVASPIAALHHALLTIHMVEHVLLMAVAPPLLLLGTPALPLRHGLPFRFGRRAVRRARRWPRASRLRRVVTHPVVCWLAPVAALIGWHVPAGFALGMRSPWWHGVQAASFLVSGLLFWTPVVRRPARGAMAEPWMLPLYLFAATLPCDALSAFLVFCDRVVYPSYLTVPRLVDMSPLRDQECAGALMWVAVTLIYIVPAVAITLELLSPRRTRAQGVVRSPRQRTFAGRRHGCSPVLDASRPQGSTRKLAT
jgi:cytochrome c oxidase assembly factor CtaG